jgi:hypothetical protein
MNMIQTATGSALDDLLIEELGTAASDTWGTMRPAQSCWVSALPSTRQANGAAAA